RRPEWRGVVDHTRGDARARQVLDHGQLRGARVDGDRGSDGEPSRGRVRIRPDSPVHTAAGRGRRHRTVGGVPRFGGGRLGHGPAPRRRRRHDTLLMARVRATRAGAILAVSDFEASLAFYRDRLGLEVVATYDDPP